MKKNNLEKGQAALFVTMIITSLVFFIGFFVTSIATKQTKVVIDSKNSVQAFYYADWGVEKVLDELGQDLISPGPMVVAEGTSILTGANYDVVVFDNTSVSPLPELVIKVTGEHKNTSRAMKLSWDIY